MPEKIGPDYGDISTIFFQDGLRMAREIIAEGANSESIVRLMQTAYESIDGLIDSFRNRCKQEGLSVDCRSGCSWCCNQAVLASNHEILVIVEYLKQNFQDNQISEFRERAAKKHAITNKMTAMEFLHFIHPCPFLENGSCMVYDVRPVACRCYLSSSEKSCRDQHDNPEDRTRIAALFDFPLQAGRGFNEGIRSALMEKELIPAEWLLETFLDAAFNNPELLDSWLGGNTPFNIRSLTPEESNYLREYNEIKGPETSD